VILQFPFYGACQIIIFGNVIKRKDQEKFIKRKRSSFFKKRSLLKKAKSDQPRKVSRLFLSYVCKIMGVELKE